MNRRHFSATLAAALLAAAPAFGATASAQLKVVTSTTDLFDIARSVGGNHVNAIHISEGYQDPHFVEAKPSFILRLRDADVFAYVGLDLEIGWMPLLVNGARNPKIASGGSGDLNISRAIKVLDVPSGNIDRSQGDVHPMGNPHYWLDPENARRIARAFRDRFVQLDPKNQADYDANSKSFIAKLDAQEKTWAPMLASLKGKPVVAYHTSWKYLAEYTGVNVIGFMEPKPGVPPSPAHLAGLIQTMKRTGAKVIIMEPFYKREDADFVARNTGAKVVILPASVGGIRNAPVGDYLSLMNYDVRQLAAALQ